MKSISLSILLLLFTLSSLFIYAQASETESLGQITKISNLDTIQIKEALEIGKKNRNSRPDTAIVYFSKALRICDQLLKTQNAGPGSTRLKYFEANALHGIALINQNKSNFTEAEKINKLSLSIREEINDKSGIAKSLNSLANIYRDLGQTTKALEYYNRSLKIREDLGDKEGVSGSLNNIALLYQDQGQIKEAIDYNERSLKISEEIKDKLGIASSLNNLAVIYQAQGQIPMALDLYSRSLRINEEINDKYGISRILNNLAIIHNNQGQINLAIDYYKRSLKLKEELKDMAGVADVYNNLATIYKSIGQINLALDYNVKSLEIKEQINYKTGISVSLNNLANIYRNQGKIDEALSYYNRSLKISKEIDNKDLESNALNGLAVLKLKQKEDSSALRYGLRSFDIAKELGYPERIREASGTLHDIYLYQKNYSAALQMYKQQILMRDSITNEENQKKSLQNKMQYEYEKTTALQKAAFDKRQDSIKLVTERRIALQSLAFEYAQKQAKTKSEEERKQLLFEEELKRNQIESDYKQRQAFLKAEQQRKEELDKAEQDKKEAIDREEKEKQRLILFSVVGGLILVLVFAGFMYNRFKVTQKQKSIIEKQKEEVEEQRELANSRRVVAEEQKEIIENQKHVVEEKQKEILDSIHYASRIQRAMLTSEEYISSHLQILDPALSEGTPSIGSLTQRGGDQRSAQQENISPLSGAKGRDYFILYKPKDIVAGDFYWAQYHHNFFYLCTADCTGHGVPGAFMSLLNIGFLNENVIERDLKMPHDVLEAQRREIIKALNPRGNEDSKDGMDCVLAAFDFENMKLHFAQANNPLVILRPIRHSNNSKHSGLEPEFNSTKIDSGFLQNKESVNFQNIQNFEILEYKAQKMAIGRSSREHEPFELQTVDLQKDDIIYTWSDGYPDQFGINGKKFMSKNLKNLLLEIAHLPLAEQKQTLDERIETHKGGVEQTDDILVIGVRV